MLIAVMLKLYATLDAMMYICICYNFYKWRPESHTIHSQAVRPHVCSAYKCRHSIVVHTTTTDALWCIAIDVRRRRHRCCRRCCCSGLYRQRCCCRRRRRDRGRGHHFGCRRVEWTLIIMSTTRQQQIAWTTLMLCSVIEQRSDSYRLETVFKSCLHALHRPSISYSILIWGWECAFTSSLLHAEIYTYIYLDIYI